MDDILLLQSDQRAAAALSRALDPPYRVRPVSDFRELNRILGELGTEVCILDVSDSPTKIPLPSLRRFRDRHPAVALVIASDFLGREMDLYHLGRLSVDGVIRIEGAPPAREIQAVVDRALARSLARRVVLGVGSHLPPLAQNAIRWTIEHAETRPQVSELAADLGVSPTVLTRDMKALGGMPPRGFLLWGRLIRASHLLERSGETVESVAFRLGYATGGALGKALRRHLGHSPTSLLQTGGLACTLDVFRRTVTQVGNREVEDR